MENKKCVKILIKNYFAGLLLLFVDDRVFMVKIHIGRVYQFLSNARDVVTKH